MVDEQQIQLLEEALQSLPQESPNLRALLLVRLAAALYWTGEDERRLAYAEAAWSLLPKVDDPRAQAQLRGLHLVATWHVDNLEERMVRAREALAVCERARDVDFSQFTRLLSAAIKLEAGDYTGSLREIAAFEEIATNLKQPQAMWLKRAFGGMLALLEGRLDDVEREAMECLTVGTRIRDNTALQTFGVQLTQLRWEQDRAGEVVPALLDFVANYPRVRGWGSSLALLRASSGDRVAAAASFEELARDGFDLPKDTVWLTSICLAMEACSLLKDQRRAGMIYQLLTPYADRVVVVGFGAACLGSVERFLGLAAATQGLWEPAVGHFERSLVVNRELGAVVLEAKTEHALAVALRATEAAVECSRAAALQAKARATAERLGLKLLLRRMHES